MLSDTAEKILERKYYVKDEDFDQLCIRVATHIGVAEKEVGYWTPRFYQLMRELWFLPGGRILANSGPAGNGNLFNCYFLGLEDNRKSIYKTLADSAEIFAHGGGIGFNFSDLREQGTPVSNGSKASGPLSFLHLYNASADVISQASRRGAMMGILDVDHPDILEFINIKRRGDNLEHFNLSVGISDWFMHTVITGEEFDLLSRYYLVEAEFETSSDYLLDQIAEAAWESGDPGILFLDTIDKYNAVPHLGKLRGCNPCGEAPLLPFEPCCLGSINLTKMLTKDGDGNYFFDSEKLIYTASVVVRFLDDAHTVNMPVLPEIGKAALATRKIGLGVMGWADTLAMLDIDYDSEKALHLAILIGTYMKKAAYESSVQLAKERGAYKAYDESKSRNIWYPNLPVTPTRNAMLMTFAPTGSISLIVGVNSGIEPFFARKYTRNVTEGEGKVQYKIEEEIKYPNVKTAHEISPEWHIRHQAVWQNFVCGAISKTINLPSDATVDEVRDIIILGWKLGLKGMTVFRDECRGLQILNRQ